MNNAGRIYGWNRWYDQLPPGWRFQVVIWSILAVSAINMALTIAVRFPFALLTLVAILFFAAVRLPYSAGWIVPADAAAAGPAGDWRLQGPSAGWLADVNRRYDETPEARRFWIIPAILLVAGAINMWLTLAVNFPFGLLFLIALLGIVAIRAPYAGGAIGPSASFAPARQATPGIAHAPASPAPAFAPHPEAERVAVDPETAAPLREPEVPAHPHPTASAADPVEKSGHPAAPGDDPLQGS